MTVGELLNQLKDINKDYEIAIGDYTITEVRPVPAIREVKLIRGMD